MKAIPFLLVSLLLVSACSGSDDSAPSASSPPPAASTSSPSAPIDVTTTDDTIVTTSDETIDTTGEPIDDTTPSFDPADAAWVIQQDAEILLVGADGVGSFSPTAENSGFDENNPDWSPDGERVSYLVADGRTDLWVVDVTGDNARKVFDCESPCDSLDDPAWSPDGASIAACKMTESDDDHLGSLVGIDVESGVETILATFAPEDFCAGPRWSPDGSEISLELGRRAGTSLFDEPIEVTLSVVNLATDPSAIRPLTDPALFASWGDWNAAGDLIVYSALTTPDASGTELFTIRPDGSDLRQLTNLAEEGSSAIEPTFDLDGSSVVFVDASSGSLRRVDLATAAVSDVFTTDVSGSHPRPRPLM